MGPAPSSLRTEANENEVSTYGSSGTEDNGSISNDLTHTPTGSIETESGKVSTNEDRVEIPRSPTAKFTGNTGTQDTTIEKGEIHPFNSIKFTKSSSEIGSLLIQECDSSFLISSSDNGFGHLPLTVLFGISGICRLLYSFVFLINEVCISAEKSEDRLSENVGGVKEAKIVKARDKLNATCILLTVEVSFKK